MTTRELGTQRDIVRTRPSLRSFTRALGRLDGGWINIPINGTGDSLMNACSQGACGAFMSEMKMSCKEAILAAAPGLKGKVSVPEEPAELGWRETGRNKHSHPSLLKGQPMH